MGSYYSWRYNGFRSVVLDACVIPEDESAACCAMTISTTFKEGRASLKKWRDTVKRLYPKEPELLQQMPHECNLTMGKLGRGGGVMTDGCDKAHKERGIVGEMIREAAIKWGIPDGEIKVFLLDCHDHARNVWWGGVTRHINKRLKEMLKDDLEEVSFNIRIHTDIDQLLIAVEKECAGTANYQKGHGSEFHHNLRR